MDNKYINAIAHLQSIHKHDKFLCHDFELICMLSFDLNILRSIRVFVSPLRGSFDSKRLCLLQIFHRYAVGVSLIVIFSFNSNID